MRDNKLTSRAGFSLPSVALGLIISMISISYLANHMEENRRRSEARIAAGQLIEVSDAAQSYIEANASAIMAAATPTVAFGATGADIQTAGFLDASWLDTNIWRQEYRLYVIEPTAGTLQGLLVTSGGKSVTGDPEFGSFTVPYAASLATSRAGFVPDTNIPGNVATRIQGTGGGWEFNAGVITNYTNPGPGHLAALINFGSGSSAQDFLYRVSVPGQPQLNQMQTDLDLGGNSIEDIANLQLANASVGSMSCGTNDNGRIYSNHSEGLFVCRDGSLELIPDSGNSMIVANITVASHNQLVPKASCPSGVGFAEQVFVAPQFVSEDGNAPPMSSIQTWPVDVGANWRINIRVSTENGESYPNSSWARVNVIQICSN